MVRTGLSVLLLFRKAEITPGPGENIFHEGVQPSFYRI